MSYLCSTASPMHECYLRSNQQETLHFGVGKKVSGLLCFPLACQTGMATPVPSNANISTIQEKAPFRHF